MSNIDEIYGEGDSPSPINSKILLKNSNWDIVNISTGFSRNMIYRAQPGMHQPTFSKFAKSLEEDYGLRARRAGPGKKRIALEVVDEEKAIIFKLRWQ